MANQEKEFNVAIVMMVCLLSFSTTILLQGGTRLLQTRMVVIYFV